LSNTLVSVIIPTRNSELLVDKTIQSIKSQIYCNIEIIIADNSSTDNTKLLAKNLGAQVIIAGPERSSQFNAAARIAKGKWLYFIGDDFILHPSIIQECMNLTRDGYDAVITWNISDPRKSRWAKCRFYERISYYGSSVYEAARFIKKSLFWKIGGFNTNLYSNEDYDLQAKLLKIGAHIARTKAYEVHIGEPSTLRELVIKSYYYGRNIAVYFKLHPKIEHMIPVRPTLLKQKFIRRLFHEWPIGFFLIPFLKIVQALSVLIGMIGRPEISPYSPSRK